MREGRWFLGSAGAEAEADDEMAASPAGAAASSAAALVVYGVLVLAVAAPFASAWNYDGHAIICNLARVSE